MEDTDQCRDCVVTFILDREDGAVVVDAAEARALRGLGDAGLVPLLRLTPRRPEQEERDDPEQPAV